MIWLWKKCLNWFGDLPIKVKLYISFGWMFLFTLSLGLVAIVGIHQIRMIQDESPAPEAINVTGTQSAHPVELRHSEHLASTLQRVVVSMLIATFVLNLLMAWRLAHLIGHPVVHVWQALERLSRRDLTVQVEVTQKDETGQMCEALNRTVGEFHNILASITDAATSLEKVAAELARHVPCTAGNCHRQSDLIQKVLSATRTLAAKSQSIAGNSQQAAEACRVALDSATSGDQVMAKASASMIQIAGSSSTIESLMGRLDERSKEIGKVVTTIREISENTNLLALNAAIEASRAGEHGRGFAVVAGEVRRLAEHTRTATEEIAAMVEGIQLETASTTSAINIGRTNVDQGQERTGEAQRMLEEIIEGSIRTESLTRETAEFAREQSDMSSQIAGNVEEVALLASASLTSAEEISTTGKHLEQSAMQLLSLVQQFTL